jgi:RimJ/RimL family protein N-acetyltransferase
MNDEITVALRKVAESDLTFFFEHQADEIAVRKAGFPSRERVAFFAHWHKIIADGSNILRTILYEDQVAGNVVSFIMNGQREVGYWLGREYWGKGIATSALRLFLGEVMERPLHAVVYKPNIASARVLEKCGFVLCGENTPESGGNNETTGEFTFILKDK